MSAFRQSIARVPEWYNEHNQEPDGSRSPIAELNHRLADCDRADCPRRFADGGLGRSFLTAIEYGLIAALIAVAAITAMQGLGNELKTTFNTTSSAMAGGNAA